MNNPFEPFLNEGKKMIYELADENGRIPRDVCEVIMEATGRAILRHADVVEEQLLHACEGDAAETEKVRRVLAGIRETTHRLVLPSGAQRQLEGFEEGRRRANAVRQERGQSTARIVLTLAHQDEVAGRPERGRAVRISRKLNGTLSPQHIRRILSRQPEKASD
jgi:hypothetical protein